VTSAAENVITLLTTQIYCGRKSLNFILIVCGVSINERSVFCGYEEDNNNNTETETQKKKKKKENDDENHHQISFPEGEYNTNDENERTPKVVPPVPLRRRVSLVHRGDVWFERVNDLVKTRRPICGNVLSRRRRRSDDNNARGRGRGGVRGAETEV
tara:strand:- start:158 stop:628 length:471 start_codon:yes stop_codon:yes gene_type:complete